MRNRSVVSVAVLSRAVLGVVSIALTLGGIHRAQAAVTTVGAVAPVPPAGGGQVVGLLNVGEGSYGSVTVTAGTGLNSNSGMTIGNTVDGIGVMSLTGFGSNYILNTAGTDITLGDEGVGTLTLTTTARVVAPDDTFIAAQVMSAGRLTVNGIGTVYSAGDDVTVGLRGDGIAEVEAGGTITSDAILLGDLDTATGTAIVTGELSRWNAGVITIGDAGIGRVEVRAGGRLSTDGLTMSVLSTADSTLIVNGANSRHHVDGASTIGDAGRATVRIENGGRIDFTNSLILGADASSQASITIDGVGSTLTTIGGMATSLGPATITLSDGGILNIGSASTFGSMGNMLLDGGRFKVPSFTLVGRISGSGVIETGSMGISATGPRGFLQVNSGDVLEVTGNVVNSGVIDLDGGEIDIRGTASNNGDIDLRRGAMLRVGSTGLDLNSGSQLAVTGGAADIFGAVDNNAGAEIAVVGSSVAVFHDAFTSAGTVFVSASSEIALLEDLDFTPSSSLRLQVADATSSGAVHVGGAANVDGSIDLAIVNGYAPAFLVRHTLMQAEALQGRFDAVTGHQLTADKWLAITYDADEVFMTAAIPGDANLNGSVAFDDLLTLAQNYGQGDKSWVAGDFSGNALVDFADLLTLAQHYGASLSLDGLLLGDMGQYGDAFAIDWARALTLVPEPGTLVAFTLALPMVSRRRR